MSLHCHQVSKMITAGLSVYMQLRLTTMSVIMSSSIASWTRSLQREREEEEGQGPVFRRVGSRRVPVPVQGVDEPPGAVFLLQQPADPCCFTVLTCSEDDGLQHVHLKHNRQEVSNSNSTYLIFFCKVAVKNTFYTLVLLFYA